ncbi:MAG: hypothetical protein ICV68_12425 [Pyrinomonadaceae bacterium]|nr:hypothetical protein [Pyrinomonadaceae bacterium]
MSEKKRQKKDGQRKDKKNEAMHDAVEERQQAGEPQPTKKATNPAEAGLGATDSARQKGGGNR